MTPGGLYVLPLLDVHAAWTLDSLHAALGPADDDFVALVLRTFSNDALVALGASTSASRLLGAAPGLIATSVTAIQSLDAARAELVNLDPRIFPAVVEEALKVVPLADTTARVSRRGTVDRSVWEAERGRVRRTAIAHRDRIARALLSALGEPSKAAVKGNTGHAEDDGALGQGLNDLADFLDAKLTQGTPEETRALGAFRLNASTARQLRDLSESVDAVSEAPRGRSYQAAQRALDLQEGRVLALFDMIVGALRAAHDVDASVPMPEFGALRSRFNTRPRKAASEEPREG